MRNPRSTGNEKFSNLRISLILPNIGGGFPQLLWKISNKSLRILISNIDVRSSTLQILDQKAVGNPQTYGFLSFYQTFPVGSRGSTSSIENKLNKINFHRQANTCKNMGRSCVQSQSELNSINQSFKQLWREKNVFSNKQIGSPNCSFSCAKKSKFIGESS